MGCVLDTELRLEYGSSLSELCSDTFACESCQCSGFEVFASQCLFVEILEPLIKKVIWEWRRWVRMLIQ